MTQGSALITGGAGFVGSVLVSKLVSQGVSVRVFDRLSDPDAPSEVQFISGDICDEQAVLQASDGVDTIYHCVSQVPLAKDAELFEAVNVGGTENVLRAAEQSGVRKVVHLSSSAIFGVPPRNPVDDSVRPAPREAYGRAKLRAEHVCERYIDKGLDIAIIRPRTVMGPGRLGIMQILFEWVFTSKNLPVLGKGDNRYQFVHVDDLVEACTRAAALPGSITLNVGAKHFDTMRGTLEGLVKHAGTGSRVRSVPRRLAVLGAKAADRLRLSPLAPYHWLMYGRSMYFDIRPVEQALSWTPKWGNIEMFCDSYDWYTNHRERLLASSGGSHHRSAVPQRILRIGSWLL